MLRGFPESAEKRRGIRVCCVRCDSPLNLGPVRQEFQIPDTEVRADFAEAGVGLHGLPEEILRRHFDTAEQYGRDMDILQQNLEAVKTKSRNRKTVQSTGLWRISSLCSPICEGADLIKGRAVRNRALAFPQNNSVRQNSVTVKIYHSLFARHLDTPAWTSSSPICEGADLSKVVPFDTEAMRWHLLKTIQSDKTASP